MVYRTGHRLPGQPIETRRPQRSGRPRVVGYQNLSGNCLAIPFTSDRSAAGPDLASRNSVERRRRLWWLEFGTL